MHARNSWLARKAQIRFFLRHWRFQWRLIGPYGRAIVICAVFLVTYGLYNIRQGILKASQEDDDFPRVLVARERCPIKIEDRSILPRLSEYTGLNRFTKDELVHNYAFNSEVDTLVFLHVQKTSGTSLLSFLKSVQPQRNTLFTTDVTINRASSCDIHMDYSRLQQCISESTGAKKRPLIVTILRDPSQRYLSEWLHLKSGETWVPTTTHCTCPQCQEISVPRCILEAKMDKKYLKHEHKRLVSASRMVNNRRSLQEMTSSNATILFQRWMTRDLSDFLSCADNPANNRQVRMLGNYDVINAHCKNFDLLSAQEMTENLLRTAKRNIKELAFFGLAGYQKESQELFHKTFSIHKLGDVRLMQSTQSHAACLDLDQTVKDKIRDLNSIDYQLYEYAQDLFFQRLNEAGLYLD